MVLFAFKIWSDGHRQWARCSSAIFRPVRRSDSPKLLYAIWFGLQELSLGLREQYCIERNNKEWKKWELLECYFSRKGSELLVNGRTQLGASRMTHFVEIVAVPNGLYTVPQWERTLNSAFAGTHGYAIQTNGVNLHIPAYWLLLLTLRSKFLWEKESNIALARNKTNWELEKKRSHWTIAICPF